MPGEKPRPAGYLHCVEGKHNPKGGVSVKGHSVEDGCEGGQHICKWGGDFGYEDGSRIRALSGRGDQIWLPRIIWMKSRGWAVTRSARQPSFLLPPTPSAR